MGSLWKALVVALAGGAGLLVACAGSEHPDSATSSGAEEETRGAQSTATAAFDPATHMRLTHHTALRMRDALVGGDMTGLKKTAEQLRVELSDELLPERLLPYRAQLDEAAQRVLDASNVAQAADAVAGVAKECGDCHWFARKGPQRFRVDTRLPTRGEETLGARMMRHGVAAEQFWIGLVGPSEDMWSAGAKTLASAPLAPPTVDDSSPRGGRVAADAEALREVAKAARLADSFEDRAQVYGRFLAACATCHRQQPR